MWRKWSAKSTGKKYIKTIKMVMRENIYAYKYKHKIEKYSFMSGFYVLICISTACILLHIVLLIYQGMLIYLGSSGLSLTVHVLLRERSFEWNKFKLKQKEARHSPVLCVWVGVVMFSFIHDRPVIASASVLTSLSDSAPVYSELVPQFSIALLPPRRLYKNACRALFWAS